MDRDVFSWCVELDLPEEAVAPMYQLLSDDERRRIARLRFEEDRRRLIVAHGALRDLLGQYLSVPPGKVHFVTNAFGKPSISPEFGTNLTFNLSHSAGIALIAVAGGADVGIDVECMKTDGDTLEVARHWFTAAEVLELRTFPAKLRKQAFYERWTRKEAWAKGRGDGLSMPEATFIAGPDGDWSLFPLRPAPGYLGALAIRGREWRLQERCWEAGVALGNDLML